MTPTKEAAFLRRVTEKMKDQIEILSPYLGSAKPITYRCKQCDEIKTIPRAGELVRKKKSSNACKKCFLKKLNAGRSEKAKENILNKLNEFKTLKILGMHKKEGNDQRWVVSLCCLECRYHWDVVGSNITRYTNRWKGCPDCWIKNTERIRKSKELLIKARIDRVQKAKEDFMNYMQSRTDVKMLGEYVHKKSTTEFQCRECKHIWPTTPFHIQNSESGCPLCSWGYTEAKRTYVESVMEIHGNDITVIDEYINSKTKIRHSCNRCKNSFEAAPNHIRKGSGCPHCHISKGEERIRRFLEANGVMFIREWKDHNCVHYKTLPMDFYLPKYNIVIEFQGVQHKKFTPRFHKTINDLVNQQKRDQLKRTYCKRNKIKLVEVWFNEMEKIEAILENELSFTVQKTG
ncbi:hypothetical protein O0Q50_19955 [Priestia aryabhattai]|uniref:Treble clef zinc finger domain-containing protein n=1 Tax=Priestia aryabhattai TaxID=412384 RepID=A0AAX6NC65_PRIAR|nr:hypothetical protein [Priestia aryabhattai]MDU9693452.1 hypothetical protein [Priestia aryabhattai]